MQQDDFASDVVYHEMVTLHERAAAVEAKQRCVCFTDPLVRLLPCFA